MHDREFLALGVGEDLLGEAVAVFWLPRFAVQHKTAESPALAVPRVLVDDGGVSFHGVGNWCRLSGCHVVGEANPLALLRAYDAIAYHTPAPGQVAHPLRAFH